MEDLEREHRDSWLTVEDLIWRPDCPERRFTWSDLKRLRSRWLGLRKDLPPWIKQYNIQVYQQIVQGRYDAVRKLSQTERQILDNVENEINEAYEHLMLATYTELGWMEKPTSVRFCEWLTRQGLPTLGLRWKRELWYRMLEWEFRKWLSRIYERSGFSHAKTVNTLMRKLPRWQSDRYGDRVWLDAQARAEVTIAWRWLLLRGRYLEEHGWEVFREILHTSPELIL